MSRIFLLVAWIWIGFVIGVGLAQLNIWFYHLGTPQAGFTDFGLGLVFAIFGGRIGWLLGEKSG